jgi:hypothetical protein
MLIFFTPNVRRITLLLAVAFAVSVALLAYAYGVNDGSMGISTSVKHSLSGPVAVLPQGKGVTLGTIGTVGPCELIYRDNLTQVSGCTLQQLIDRYGPPDKIASWYDTIAFSVDVVYLSKGFHCESHENNELTRWQEAKITSCNPFEPTTWDHYYKVVIEDYYKTWSGFDDLFSGPQN